MRIDIKTCRDPELLAAEVRRLQGVIAAGEATLTDEEREVLGRVADDAACRAMQWTEKVVRGLLERLTAIQLKEAADEIARLRLTDEEREALDYMLRHAAWAASKGAFADSGDYRLHHDAVFRIMGR